MRSSTHSWLVLTARWRSRYPSTNGRSPRCQRWRWSVWSHTIVDDSYIVETVKIKLAGDPFDGARELLAQSFGAGALLRGDLLPFLARGTQVCQALLCWRQSAAEF